MNAALAIDSSVIIAILNREPEEESFERAIELTDRVLGWPTVFEVRLWALRRRDHRITGWLDRFIGSQRTTCVPFDGPLETLASEAFGRFGKGRHPASLNFGDCMTYAVARARSLPLLFKGDDFSRTDVDIHPASAFSR